MDMIPHNNYGERCQFDAYCKLVLYHEAIDYLREMQRRRDRELSFSDLPQMEIDKLCVVITPVTDLHSRPTGMTCILKTSLWLMPSPVCLFRSRVF